MYDPHNCERRYQDWKAKGMEFEGINKANADLIRQFLQDMELGRNISPKSKKGPRSYIRLINLKWKLATLAYIFEREIEALSFEELKDKDLEVLQVFHKLREGQIKSKHQYLKSPGTYIKIFKSFWHWVERVKRKQGEIIPDITIDLDGKDEKPDFNYITYDQAITLHDYAQPFYKTMILFLFDSGIRAPTELMNIKVSDLEWNNDKKIYSCNIREEISKTFGRKIKLLLCSDSLKRYINQEKLQENDYIFQKSPKRVNEVLKKLGNKLFGIGESQKKYSSGKKYTTVTNGLTMYDFRHSSACYWLPRYKSESALKYRFGWKKSNMIHYYTNFLGMKDTIDEDDMYIDSTKTELEKKLYKQEIERESMKEDMIAMQKDMKKMQKTLATLKILDKNFLEANIISDNEKTNILKEAIVTKKCRREL